MTAPKAVVLAERRDGLRHHGGRGPGAGLRALRAQLPLRPAPRRRARGGAAGRRRRSASRGTWCSTIDLRAFGGSALTGDLDGAQGHAARADRRRDPGHVRPRPEHHLPLLRAGLGRGARAHATSSSARTPWTTAATPTAGRSTSRPSSGWRTSPPAPASRARRLRIHTPLIAPQQGARSSTRGMRAGGGLSASPAPATIRRPTARPAAAATPVCSG